MGVVTAKGGHLVETTLGPFGRQGVILVKILKNFHLDVSLTPDLGRFWRLNGGGKGRFKRPLILGCLFSSDFVRRKWPKMGA